MSSSSLPRAHRRGALTHAGALAQLAVVGIVGVTAFSILLTVFSTGVGLAVLGVGLVLLVGVVYGLYALAWLESERTEGLYGFGIPPLAPVRRTTPGFGGWLRTLGRQAIDGQMWRAVANLAIATVLGLAVLPLVAWFVHAVGLLFSPLRGTEQVAVFGDAFELEPGLALLVGLVGMLVSAALLVGIAALHAVLTRAILVPSREAVLAEQARAAGAQRAGAVRASEVERTRIERDLHDGVQPRLVSVAMTLGLAQQQIDDDPAGAKALVAEAHTSTKAAITELRQLARGIHTSVLEDRGLDAALSALAARSPIPVLLDVRLEGRCSSAAEAAVYFTVAEALTNAAKHSRGSEARVVIRRRSASGTDGDAAATRIWARIEDNGVGGAEVQPGGGLDGISNRVLAAGGSIRIDSPAGGPTALEVSVPCAS